MYSHIGFSLNLKKKNKQTFILIYFPIIFPKWFPIFTQSIILCVLHYYKVRSISWYILFFQFVYFCMYFKPENFRCDQCQSWHRKTSNCFIKIIKNDLNPKNKNNKLWKQSHFFSSFGWSFLFSIQFVCTHTQTSQRKLPCSCKAVGKLCSSTSLSFCYSYSWQWFYFVSLFMHNIFSIFSLYKLVELICRYFYDTKLLPEFDDRCAHNEQFVPKLMKQFFPPKKKKKKKQITIWFEMYNKWWVH